MLTYKNLRDQVQTFLDTTAETDGVAVDTVNYALQTANEKRSVSQRWNFLLWPKVIPITFYSGKREYLLHQLAGMVTNFYVNSGDLRQQMVETPTRARYKENVVDDRFHFEFVKDSPIGRKPIGFYTGSTGKVTVVGSAKLEYLVTETDTDVTTETVTDTTTTYNVYDIVSVTKMTNAVLTLTDAGSNSLLSLTAAEYEKRYSQIRLYGDGANETGYYQFYRKPHKLTDDNDLPDIPYPFSRILVYDALLELATYNDSVPPSFWLAQQADWERKMVDFYQEGEAEGSETRTVAITDTYEG